MNTYDFKAATEVACDDEDSHHVTQLCVAWLEEHAEDLAKYHGLKMVTVQDEV